MPNLRFGFQIIVVFITLINIPFAASRSKIIQTSLQGNEGYRCGGKAYSRGFLVGAASEASKHLFADISPNSDVVDTSFPKAYKGPIKFGEENLYLWPLSAGGQISSHTEIHFLVLGKSLDSIFSVVRGQELDLKKCIKEDDLSNMYGSQDIVGYRCPLNFHSSSTIQKQILNAKYQTRGKLPSRRVRLKYFKDSNIYHDINQFWGWSIIGKQHTTAITSILIDEKFSFIGVVERGNGKYTKCLVTATNKITPKFVGKAILQQAAERINEERVDYFRCGPNNNHISSKQVLIAASAANRRFQRLRQGGSRSKYPAPYDGHSEKNSELYLWPMRFDNNGNYVAKAKISDNEKYLIIIDNFSDVHGLIMRESLTQTHECQRTTYSSRPTSTSSTGSNSDDSGKRTKIN